MSEKTQAETTFGSIEGAADYLALLLASVNEAHEDLETEALVAASVGAERRLQAIQLANYKLSQLRSHLTTSHRLLNDLRTIRRLLFAERQGAVPAGEPAKGPAQFVTRAEGPGAVSGLRPGPRRPLSPGLDG